MTNVVDKAELQAIYDDLQAHYPGRVVKDRWDKLTGTLPANVADLAWAWLEAGSMDDGMTSKMSKHVKFLEGLLDRAIKAAGPTYR